MQTVQNGSNTEVSNEKKTRKSFTNGCWFMVTSLFGTAPFAVAADFTGKTIDGISIIGNKTVSEGAILSVVRLKAGDTFDGEAIRQDMKAIYDLSDFYDVQANFLERRRNQNNL